MKVVIFSTAGFPFLGRCPLLTALAFLCLFSQASTAAALPDVETPQAESVRQMLRRAEKLIERGAFDEAETVLRRAADAAGKDSYPTLRLAQLYAKRRRLTEAYELSYPIAAAEPKNAYAFSVLGATMLGAGRFRDARALFYKALSLDKRQNLAWAGLGMLDFYENRIAESLNNLATAVFYDADDADAIFAYAQVAARAENYREAAAAYDRFLVVSRNTDDERRARIRGLINFLNYLGQRKSLYNTGGADSTTVPIEIVGNRPVITVRVNERAEPLKFVLDTGSGITVISDDTAKRLGINPITRGGYAKGIGGDGKFEIVYGFLREVSIGEAEIRNVPVYIRRFHPHGSRVDGYIGLSLISKFLTTLDYGSRTFALTKLTEGGEVPAAGEGVSLPLRLTSSGFLSGEVQLGGVESPLNFIVDTGASVSVISDELAGLDAISPFANAERMRVVGSAGVTENVQSFQLPSVSFGSHSRKDITAIALNLDLINEASGFQQAGILGGNFLRNYRLTFDFRNSRVTFAPLRAEQ